MQSMKFIGQVMFMFLVAVLSAQAVPPVLNYAGQVAVNGQPFEGEGLFKFALVNANGNITYWSNDGTSVKGSEPQASVKAPVSGGLYSLLLGNTAIPGMGAINPQVFSHHSDAKLRVWFSDGVNGFQQLSPDRPFASVPYAFSAGTAQSTTIAVGSINKSMLGSDVLADLNKSVTITRDMLPQDVKDDLNKTITITRDMLPQDVREDLNATIGMDRLSAEVITKLDQNGSGGSGVVAGSLISLPYGQTAPAGYSIYQRGTPKELVWEEKTSVSIARYAHDGVEVLNGKIYFVGGHNSSGEKNIAERYDPTTNTWETLAPMSVARGCVAATVLNGKLYAIGGRGLSSVEIFDPSSELWSAGLSLPNEVKYGNAITADGRIYLVGGQNASNQNIKQVLCFDPSTNQWTAKANMPTARHGMKLVWFENRIWAIGGKQTSLTEKVESYDPVTDSWQSEASLITARYSHFSWVANGKIYVGGGGNGNGHLNSIESLNPTTKTWSNVGILPEARFAADAVVLNDKVYFIAGSTPGVYSNKVFAADLSASVAGVYDLYRKDGNASAGTPLVQAEVADGSVTASKMADGSVTSSKIASNTITTSDLSEQILKYLKPEITAQPQAQTVYADSNVSYSVSAEGKYLTYQWKKDGNDLAGETNATLNITDANATQHEGNYSVVVSNDFGSVESGGVEFLISDWSPHSLSGLTLWLDASDNSTIVKSSNLISVWNDKSSNQNNAFQHTQAHRPSFVENSINGLSSIKFSNHKFQFTPIDFSGKSVFVTFITDLIPDDEQQILGHSSINVQFRINRASQYGHFGYAAAMSAYSGNNFGSSIQAQKTSIVALIFAENLEVRVNGISQIMGAKISSGSTVFNQIGARETSEDYFKGNIAEIIVFDDANSFQKINCEGYLAHKWGLAADLPSDHPYKNNAP
jgi:N-acetylneuraminic acid mutarotase